MNIQRIVFLTIAAASVQFAMALHKEVCLAEAGTLSEFITDAEKGEITSLTVKGPVNGTDMSLIRYMGGGAGFDETTPGKLESLDLSEARITAEETPYLTLGDDAYSSEEDVLGPFMLYNCGSLTSIKLPAGLREIGDSSLGWCKKLAAVEIPEGVWRIGPCAFTFCESITRLDIPDAVTEVGSSCFEYMSSLRELHLGNGIRVLPRHALLCDDALTDLYLGKAFRVYENNFRFSDLPRLQAFHVDADNLKYSSADGVLYSRDGSVLYAFPGSKEMTSYTLPASVEEIEAYAFANNSKLESVTIPGTVRLVGNNAFYYASALSSVVLEEGVESIGSDCFSFTSNIREISLPASLTQIGGGAFSYCLALETISVDESNPCFTTSGRALYSKDLRRFFCLPHVYALTLTEFDFHPECLVVEPGSLDGLQNIRSLSFMGRIRNIGDGAASGCFRLEKVTLGPTVTHIGAGAFVTHALKEVECVAPMLEDVDDTAFQNGTLAEEGTLYVPEGTSYFYMMQPWVYNEDMHLQIFANVVEKSFVRVEDVTLGDNDDACSWYSVDGRRLQRPVRGINIRVSPDGSTRKVMMP